MAQAEKLALWFSVEGDLKFLSHRFMMLLWHRALVRAGTPLRYSQGFNPHPRLSLPLPKNVGVSSKQELLVLEVQQRDVEEELQQKIQNQLPLGMRIINLGYTPDDFSAQPQWAGYHINLNEKVNRATLARRIESFLQSTDWPVLRPARGRHPQRTVNLRAGISHLELKQNVLHCTIPIHPSGTARIEELLTALDLNGPEQLLEICRVAVGYPNDYSVN